MKKAVYVLSSIFSVAAAIGCIITTVYAVRFGEIGRVVFYGVGAIIFAECAALVIPALIRELKK